MTDQSLTAELKADAPPASGPSLSARLVRATLLPIAQAALSSERTMAQRRSGLDRAARLTPAPSGLRVRDDEIAGLRVRWLTPAEPRPGVLVYLHGGAYCVGSIASHSGLAGRLAKAAGMRCVLVDYRLAPEHPFPAGLDDALATTRAARALEPGPLVLAGDSAGGGLALALACLLRDAGEAADAQALFSPWLDLTFTGESLTSRAEAEGMLSEDRLREAAAIYRGLTPADDPRISPLWSDLRGLGPSLIQVGDAEILLSDSERLHARLTAAGCTGVLTVAPHMWHVWHAFAPLLAEGRAAIADAGAWIRGVVHAG